MMAQAKHSWLAYLRGAEIVHLLEFREFMSKHLSIEIGSMLTLFNFTFRPN
jgi:hypothetical protein